MKEINTKELSRENIFFTGGISNSVVKKRLLNNDIFICTSKYEVLPISILEAVEAANIVITRNYPYADDILNRFSSSVIFTNIEEVIKIRSNNNLLKSLNINAIKERKLIESNYNKYINKIKNYYSLSMLYLIDNFLQKFKIYSLIGFFYLLFPKIKTK